MSKLSKVVDDMRIPQWDGKLVLAGIFIVGYYFLVITLVLGTNDLAETKSGIVRDAMMALGPAIGIIIGALFRTTAADERIEARRTEEVKTVLSSPPGANGTLPGAVAGATYSGAKAGVAEGLEEQLGAVPHVETPATFERPSTEYEGPDLSKVGEPLIDAPEEPQWRT